MIRNFLSVSLRNLIKQKGYLLINVFGLAIGLTSFIFISLYVISELSYERFFSNNENIYRVYITGRMAGQDINQVYTAEPMAATMIKDYPQIKQVTRVAVRGAWLIRYEDVKFNEDGVLFADSTFFDIFDFSFVQGDPKTALKEPKSMVMTESYARKYFGEENALGKQLHVEEDSVLYTVTAVIKDLPFNTHFDFDLLASLNSIRPYGEGMWVSHNYITYVMLNDGTDVNKLDKDLEDLVFTYVGPQIEQFLGITIEDFHNAGNFFTYHLESVNDIHLRAGNKDGDFNVNSDIIYVYIFSIIALLILIIAIINFINLSTAQSAGRAKEVGIRKVSGSTKGSLIFQFLSESVILTIVSMIIALVMVKFLFPSFLTLTGKNFELTSLFGVKGIFFLIALTLITGIVSGLYPAFILAKFRPAEVLKGSVSRGAKSSGLRSVLVVVQFTVSIFIIIGTFVVYQQLNYMQNQNLGFDDEQLLMLRRPDALKDKIEIFKEIATDIQGVESLANARGIPGKQYSNNAFNKEDDPDKNNYLLQQNWVSFGYPETMGFELVEGRFFSRDFPTDSTGALINETAVKMLGWDYPVVGNILLQPGGRKFTVIGVMKDYHNRSLQSPVEPVCLNAMQGNMEGYLCIRINTRDIQKTIKEVENLWYDYVATQPFQYFFFDDDFNKQYESEVRISRIFIVFAVLAILIACLGLLGLIAYTTTVRTKEIGIRKVHGASVNNIIRILSTEVIKLILISTLVAWPIAYFASKYWLQDFATRIKLNPVIFISAVVIALITAWLTIGIQAIRAANRNPADSLRYE